MLSKLFPWTNPTEIEIKGKYPTSELRILGDAPATEAEGVVVWVYGGILVQEAFWHESLWWVLPGAVSCYSPGEPHATQVSVVETVRN